ncbi:MAG: thioesterase family protein [Blastochloris sp.]|nr:thioesterase family protein [Blastochloris sp.]
MTSQLPDRPELTSRVKVYFYDTDAGGVVHNIAYLRMVEQVRSDFAELLGWKLGEMTRGGDCPVVARTEIDYVKPARLGDTLIIGVKLVRMEKVRFHLEFTIQRDLDEVLLSRVKQVMVPVSLATMRPVALRKDWLAKWPELSSV